MSKSPTVRKAPRQTKHEGEFKLAPDRIDADGIYDISAEKYRSDCCVAHSVSGSGLVTIETQSLLHYWNDSYLNPEREEKSTPAMLFGIAAHYAQLGEIAFSQRFVVKPYDSYHSNEAKAWRDAQTKQIISKSDFDKIGNMARVLAKHPLAKMAFRDGKPEQSVIWKDTDTGLYLKSRPDWLSATSPFICDFKSSASAHPRDFVRTAFKLHYNVKAALQVDGFKALGRDITPYFIVQETEAPFAVLVAVFRPHDLEFGRLLYRGALRRLAGALARGTKREHFPGYNDDKVAYLTMPQWQETEILARKEAGEFKGLVEGE